VPYARRRVARRIISRLYKNGTQCCHIAALNAATFSRTIALLRSDINSPVRFARRVVACCAGPIAIGFAAPAAAQSVDSQIWIADTVSADIAKHVAASFDTTMRFSDAAHGLYQWARGGTIGVRTRGGTELLTGYQRVTDYSDGHVSKLEQRIREQVNYGFGRIGPGTLSGRLRVEERFRRGADGVGVRARTQLRYTLPLGNKTAPSLVLIHESFLELNDTRWGQRAGLRRVRDLVGLEVPIAKNVRIQAGYLNQYDFGLPGKRDAMANIFSLALAERF